MMGAGVYDWVLWITCALWLVTLAGIFFRLPIFLNKRRLALLAFVLVPFTGDALAKAVISPEKKAQFAREETARDAKRRAENEAHGELLLTKSTLVATCGGSCLSLSGAVMNPTTRDRKDPIIKCAFEGDSGTVISIQRETLYKVVRAGQTVQFRGLDMGFKPGQSTTATCGVLASSEG